MASASTPDTDVVSPSAPSAPETGGGAGGRSESDAVDAADTADTEPFVEPILRPTLDRFTLFPIRYPKVFEMYGKHQRAFWTAQEIDLARDVQEWERLSPDERFFLSNILAFFAASDGIVNENLAMNFATEVQIPEARCFYGFQMAMENVHSEVYSLLIDTFVKDTAEKARLLNAIETVPCVRRKAEWALRYTDPDRSTFAERVVAFAAVEGIHFSGSFCAIYWLRSRGMMPGLCFSNDLISRDEGLHCDFAVLMHSMLERPLPTAGVQRIIREAVDIEIQFVTESLPVELLGMNSKEMSAYIRFVADRLLTELGSPKIYGDANPFDFADMIGMDVAENLHERQLGNYQRSKGGSLSAEKAFALDADF